MVGATALSSPEGMGARAHEEELTSGEWYLLNIKTYIRFGP